MALPQDRAEPSDKDTPEDIIRELELGSRTPGRAASRLLFGVALAWSVYQLYVASPLPFALDFLILNDTQQRPIHLAFALFLAFCTFPAFRSSPRNRVPSTDWGLAVIGAISCLYLVVFYEEVISRAGGQRTAVELFVSIAGMLCVLEATRRALGIWLVLIIACFLFYAFAGPWMPAIISHAGTSLNHAINHLWLTTEGVFGISLGISNSLIFLYVLFGSLLERAGAGNYFIQLAFALLGTMRGGPAKAAVVASGMTGMISGSAIANVVTTGTFTIPIMKRVGFTAEKAGAIETSASINGQIMPPIMGAAAFLMTEFIGMPYVEVIKHAFLPAIMAYIGLFYVVHVEAIKLKIPTLRRTEQRSLLRKGASFLCGLAAILVASSVIYFGLHWLKGLLGPAAVYVIIALYLATYLILLWISTRYPKLKMDDPEGPLPEVPATLPTLMAGLHFFLPVVVLVWCLVVERFSAQRSVAWAILAVVVMLLTQRPLLAVLRKDANPYSETWKGFVELVIGLVAGARNMVGIAIALAAAGFVVGVISMTGIGLLMTAVIETISGGSLIVTLLLTGVMCVILGMGLPTTANYIVVASVMVHPIVTLAAQSGVIMPLIAVHLFVFYLGLISGTTPPVAVDAFAGAAVAKSKPIATAIQAFVYDMRTSILPFMFVFNTELLLIGIGSIWHFLLVAAVSITAMLAFVAATQRYFIVRCRLWECAVLLLAAFMLLRPGFFLDLFYPPFDAVEPAQIVEFAERQPSGGFMRLDVEGPTFSGGMVRKVVVLPLGPKGASGEDRLYEHAGISVAIEDGQAIIEDLRFDSPAQRAGIDFDWVIHRIEVPAERPSKQWFYIPGLALLALVAVPQLRRSGAASRRESSRSGRVPPGGDSILRVDPRMEGKGYPRGSHQQE